MTSRKERIDASWRAANHLSVGQIYLVDNTLLREPLTQVHIKPRLLGHWVDPASESMLVKLPAETARRGGARPVAGPRVFRDAGW